MIALTIGLLLIAAALVYALGRYEEAHLEDAFDSQGRKRLGMDE